MFNVLIRVVKKRGKIAFYVYSKLCVSLDTCYNDNQIRSDFK